MHEANYSSCRGLRSAAIHKNAANPRNTIPIKIRFSIQTDKAIIGPDSFFQNDDLNSIGYKILRLNRAMNLIGFLSLFAH
jgi:hypothetical protein